MAAGGAAPAIESRQFDPGRAGSFAADRRAPEGLSCGWILDNTIISVAMANDRDNNQPAPVRCRRPLRTDCGGPRRSPPRCAASCTNELGPRPRRTAWGRARLSSRSAPGPRLTESDPSGPDDAGCAVSLAPHEGLKLGLGHGHGFGAVLGKLLPQIRLGEHARDVLSKLGHHFGGSASRCPHAIPNREVVTVMALTETAQSCSSKVLAPGARHGSA